MEAVDGVLLNGSSHVWDVPNPNPSPIPQSPACASPNPNPNPDAPCIFVVEDNADLRNYITKLLAP
jgi:hypothetical protein